MIKSNSIIGEALDNIPWQDRPQRCSDVVWRYSNNPVIPRHASPSADSIYNSAVVPFKDGFAGVFRCDNRARNMTLRRGFSKDGLHFEIEDRQIPFVCHDPEIGRFIEGYDPRVIKLDKHYYINWCNTYHGWSVALGYTDDFEIFHLVENITLPYNRNGVLFPRKINGNYAMLSRPSDAGHTPFGDIFYSESPDLVHWGRHRWVMGPKKDGTVNWEMTKVGAGPVPIETTQGWLLFYHGVITTCNGYTYSMGAAILDIDKPWRVKYRCKTHLLTPEEIYELAGNTPNVVFPCAALTDAETGRIAIYYGAADTCTGLAFCHVDELIEYIKENSVL